MRCAGEVGWYEPIWQLIATENSRPTDMDVMEAELVQVVIEIIYIVMWSGIIGSDLNAWTVSLLCFCYCIILHCYKISNYRIYS